MEFFLDNFLWLKWLVTLIVLLGLAAFFKHKGWWN